MGTLAFVSFLGEELPTGVGGRLKEESKQKRQFNLNISEPKVFLKTLPQGI